MISNRKVGAFLCKKRKYIKRFSHLSASISRALEIPTFRVNLTRMISLQLQTAGEYI